ncbi:MAG: hypothetical protein WBV39_05190 [Rudaea sp.]
MALRKRSGQTRSHVVHPAHVIDRTEETRLPVVAMLHNVLGNIGNAESWFSRHDAAGKQLPPSSSMSDLKNDPVNF